MPDTNMQQDGLRLAGVSREKPSAV